MEFEAAKLAAHYMSVVWTFVFLLGSQEESTNEMSWWERIFTKGSLESSGMFPNLCAGNNLYNKLQAEACLRKEI